MNSDRKQSFCFRTRSDFLFSCHYTYIHLTLVLLRSFIDFQIDPIDFISPLLFLPKVECANLIEYLWIELFFLRYTTVVPRILRYVRLSVFTWSFYFPNKKCGILKHFLDCVTDHDQAASASR